MKRLENRHRAERLMRAVIRDLELDLSDISVLTEAASGAFAVTSLLALLSGARRVVAVTRDSSYGRADEVAAYVGDWAATLGAAERLEIAAEPALHFAAESSLVTNLGFVRPLNGALIARLPADSAIALMVEPWECRPEDVDLGACRKHDVPALGTWESHPRLETFRYVGMVVLKLLFEAGIEAFRSRVLILGSDPFGAETKAVLDSVGATTSLVDLTAVGVSPDPVLRETLLECDAVAVVEYRKQTSVIGGETGLPIAWLADRPVPILHVCGVLDEPALIAAGLVLIPAGPVRPGFMKVLTDFVGPRPVVDLHAGGLKVGELLVRGRRATGTAEGAVRHALNHPIALDFDGS